MSRYRCTECDKLYASPDAAARCHWGIGGVVEVSRYLRTTRARSTGLLVTTGHGDDLGLDATGEGPWYNVCEDHREMCSHATLALAKLFAPAPEEWCAVCSDNESPEDER